MEVEGWPARSQSHERRREAVGHGWWWCGGGGVQCSAVAGCAGAGAGSRFQKVVVGMGRVVSVVSRVVRSNRKGGIIVAVNSNRNQFSLLQNNCSPTAFVSLPVSRSLLVPVASSLSLIRCCKMIAARAAALPLRRTVLRPISDDLHRASLAPLGIHDKLPASEAFGAGTKTDLDLTSQSGPCGYGSILLKADGISHRPGETKRLSVNHAIRGICMSACLARNVEMRIPYATLADCSPCCKCVALAGQVIRAERDMNCAQLFSYKCPFR
jgi:hypothetical protein